MDLLESYEKILERHKHFAVLFPAFLIGLILIVLSFIRIAVHFVDSADNVLVYFDYYKGVEMGSSGIWYGVLATASLIFLLNLGLSLALFRKAPFLSYTLAMGALIVSVLIFLATAGIIAVN